MDTATEVPKGGTWERRNKRKLKQSSRELPIACQMKQSDIFQPIFVIHHHKLQHFLPRLKRQIQSTGEGGAKEVKVKSMPYQFENPSEDDVCLAVKLASANQPLLRCTLQSGVHQGRLIVYQTFFSPTENHTAISHIWASHSHGKFAMIHLCLPSWCHCIHHATKYIMRCLQASLVSSHTLDE